MFYTGLGGPYLIILLFSCMRGHHCVTLCYGSAGKVLFMISGASSLYIFPQVGSVQFTSVAQSCPTLCDPMNHNTPGLPVHHQLLEFTQTHVHQVGDAIQPSHPLSSPSPPPNPSQHQAVFQ